jgi:hypothetical protein
MLKGKARVGELAIDERITLDSILEIQKVAVN